MHLLGYNELKAKKGINYSRTHIWRLIKAGRFPRPIKMGGGARNSWVEEEIDAFIAALIAERDADFSAAQTKNPAPRPGQPG
jgi:prophage regulatory protein